MKVTIEIDCTPVEARIAMGLPDLSPIHDRYIAALGETMQGGIKPEMIEQMMKNWAPMGEAGLAFWRRLFDSGAKSPG